MSALNFGIFTELLFDQTYHLHLRLLPSFSLVFRDASEAQGVAPPLVFAVREAIVGLVCPLPHLP